VSVLRLRVSPGAKKSGFQGVLPDGRTKVSIAAPPVDGRANEVLIAFLARALDLPKRSLRLAHGAGGRDKVVEVDLEPEELAERLARALEAK
jgi:uncharacterized protein (TIGR00251 family)